MRMYPILLLVVGLALSACDDPGGPSTQTPSTGTLVVSTSTEGDDPDQDGYLLTVDGVNSLRLDPTGTADVDLASGRHTLRLLDVARHCSVAPGTALEVTVPPRSTTPVAFKLSCPASTTSGNLAFESGGDIYVADLDGSDLRRLTFDGSPNSYNREAAWSPNGSRIAFSKSDGQWGAEIYVIDPDGANPKRLSPKGAYDATPTWSPDGSRIAFENRRDNQSNGQIFVMNADGTHRAQLTSNRQPNSSPAWSPDGHRIAYVTYSDGLGDGGTAIFVMNADGTNRLRLTNEEWETDPEWSPDGNRIVFSRSDDLVVMDADGTNLTRLTPARSAPGGSSQPAWSPDGGMIAFTRATNCRVDPYGDWSCDGGIWVVSTADGQMHELSLGRASGPSWRP